MITPNNNAIIWRNLAKKLRLRRGIVRFDASSGIVSKIKRNGVPRGTHHL